MNEKRKVNLSYADSGVNIDAMDESIDRIEKDVRSTFNTCVIENVRGFGTLYKPVLEGMEEPVLVSSCDGVGTKLMVARLAGDYSTVGHDLVNHCVNDILVQGAKPLYFLDYVGAGVIEPEFIEEVVSGLARGCRENGVVLIGGETAEMPGIYSKGDFDLAGTIVGIADRKSILTGAGISEGDVILGFLSNGLHTNGYSLARKLFFEIKGFTVDSEISELGCTIGEELLKVHKSYFNIIFPNIERFGIQGLAHITGGGLYDNIPRILPEEAEAHIDPSKWDIPPVFTYIQNEGGVERREMFRTFNMGIGMVAVLPKGNAEQFIHEAETNGEKVLEIGEIVKGNREVIINGA